MPKLLLRCLALCLLSAPLLHATPINVNLTFRAFGFNPGYTQGTVDGTFGVTLDNVTGSVLGINSVTMEIGGHHYTVAELGYGETGGGHFIAASVNGLFVVPSNSNDFYFSWNYAAGPNGATYTPTYFQYSTLNSLGAYYTQRFDAMVITPGANPNNPPPVHALPEAGATASLLACTLLGLAWAKRRAVGRTLACSQA